MKQEEESRHPRGFVNRSREEKIKRIEENKRVYPISDYRRKTKVGNEGGEKMEISRQHSMRSGVALLRRSGLWARSCLCVISQPVTVVILVLHPETVVASGNTSRWRLHLAKS